MDNRFYFVLGDVLANVFLGGLVGLLCGWLIEPGWNMWLAMFIAMAAGMVLALVVWIPVSIFLGAMEVMVPLMMGGMVAGMVVGMAEAMMPLTNTVQLLSGALCGLLTLNAIWMLNGCLRGVKYYD